MVVDYMKTLDSVYAKCNKWSYFIKTNVDEYMTYSLYSVGNARPYEKAEHSVIEWKQEHSQEGRIG